MTEEKEIFHRHIQRAGLKRTAQRDTILDVFLRTEKHLSSEDLYHLVQEEDPNVGHTTVYRTLKLLVEAGLAGEGRFGDGRTRYEHNYTTPTPDTRFAPPSPPCASSASAPNASARRAPPPTSPPPSHASASPRRRIRSRRRETRTPKHTTR